MDLETGDSAKELAEVELEIKRITAALKEAEKEGDTDLYAKLRQEQLRLRESSKQLRREVRDQAKDFAAAELPDDSIIALRRQYIRLKNELLEISTTDAGFDKKSLEAKQLNDRIKELEKNLGDTRRNVGNYQEAVEGALGNVQAAIGGNISAIIGGLGAGGAVIAGIDLVQEGLNQVRMLAEEIVQIRGEVQRVTGLTGESLREASSEVAAIAETYNKDVQQLLVATNSAAERFGLDFSEALRITEQGLLSAADANGDFLNQVQEYPSVLNDVGISFEEFVALQATAAEAGIFDDKLIDAIKEADLALSELTQTQLDALAPLGSEFVDGLAQRLREGTVTTVDALLEIREQADAVGLDFQQLQTITADVLKGAGEDAGGFLTVTDILAEGVNRNFDSIVDTTNELTQAQLRSREANRNFADAQQELADVLGNANNQLEPFLTNLRAGFLRALIELIERAKNFFAIFRPLIDALRDYANQLGIFDKESRVAAAALKVLNFNAKIAETVIKAVVATLTGIVRVGARINQFVVDFGRNIGVIRSKEAKAQEETEKTITNIRGTTEDFLNTIRKQGDAQEDTNEKTREGAKALKDYGDVAEKITKTGIAALESQVAKLRENLAGAETKEAYAQTLAQIRALEEQIAKTTATYQAFAAAQQLSGSRAEDLERFAFSGQGFEEEESQLSGQSTGEIASIVNDPEALRERALADYKKQVREELAQFSDEKREEQLEKEREFYEAQVGILESSAVKFGEALGQLAADGEITLQDFGKAAALIALDTAEQVVNLAIAQLFAGQVATSGFLGIAKAAILQGIIKGFTSAIFASIRNSIGEFAEGGAIGQTEPGIIRNRPNVRTTSKGDNVLILAKRGEMVLNENQQRRAQSLFGEDIWSLLGVPGFNIGGLVSAAPQLVPATSNITRQGLAIEDFQIAQLAETIAQRTAQENGIAVREGVRQGIEQANRNQTALDNLRKTATK